MKRTMSRLAGLSLFWLARVGTRDATNSFKAYSRPLPGRRSASTLSKGFEIRNRARRQGAAFAPASGRAPDTVIDRSDGQFELPHSCVAAQLSALVLLRLRLRADA